MKKFDDDRCESDCKPADVCNDSTQHESSDAWLPCPEAFPATEVLQDLETIGADATAATAVLARFAVLQFFLQTAAGATPVDELADDRRLILPYLDDSVSFRPGEREALLTISRLAGTDLVQPLVGALLAAGTAAERWRHLAGGRVCFLTAYHLASESDLPAECAAAAYGIAACSTELRSIRLWRRRAKVWQRRSAREG